MAQKPSLSITIAATQAHRQFGELLRRAFSGTEHFVIEKDGLPVAVILSMAEYKDLIQERERLEEDRLGRLHQFHEAARALGQEIEKTGLSEEQVTNLLNDAKRQVYHRHYDTDQP